MIKVNVVYDKNCNTWNVMTIDKECLSFGSAEFAQKWLDDHADTHAEFPWYSWVKLVNTFIIVAGNRKATDREISKRNSFNTPEAVQKWCDELNEFNQLQKERLA